MAASTALVPIGNDINGFSAYLTEKKAQINMVCAKHMDADRIVRVLLNCVSRTPALRMCTPVSIFRATMQAAELGLEPGSALGEAYLVPYKSECQLIPGYRGLVTLARRSGEISNIWAEVVYEGDEFEAKYGLHPDVLHVPKFQTQDASKIQFAYACARFRTGETQFIVMHRTEIDRIRARSAAGRSDRSPWSTDTAEMAKKTAVKRLCKMLPMSVEMARAVKLDNAHESGDYSDVEFDVVDAMPDPEQTAPRPEETAQPQPTKGASAARQRTQSAANQKEEAAPVVESSDSPSTDVCVACGTKGPIGSCQCTAADVYTARRMRESATAGNGQSADGSLEME